MKEKRPALIGYLARPQRLKCNQSGYFGDLMKRSLFVEQHNLCHDTRAHGIVFLSDVFTLINLSGYSLASGAFFTSGETGMERNFYWNFYCLLNTVTLIIISVTAGQYVFLQMCLHVFTSVSFLQ